MFPFHQELRDSVDTSPSIRILAVDDSSDNLFLLESILDNPNYHLTSVQSGEAALDEVFKTPPDLILLDIMMPQMNGYEVTQRIRQHPNLPYIPILLVTAHDHLSLVEGLDAGADDFIRKPFDIEELKARVRSLLRLKKAMDTQTFMIRQRDDFVARLTHDLRTPLVAANRMLKFCQDEALGTVADGAKEAIKETIENNKQLLAMVNTLLEVYRHDAGRKTLTFTDVNIVKIITAVKNELAPLTQDKNLQLVCIDDTESAGSSANAYTVLGDAMELRRVLTNLVGNAIKFTDRGSVKIQLSVVDHPPEALQLPSTTAGWLRIAVQDTGIGMSKADQAKIFDWFRQGNQRRAGSGLGLHLSHRIIQKHDGGIEVTSELNRGSTFTVYLPLQPT